MGKIKGILVLLLVVSIYIYIIYILVVVNGLIGYWVYLYIECKFSKIR